MMACLICMHGVLSQPDAAAERSNRRACVQIGVAHWCGARSHLDPARCLADVSVWIFWKN